MNWINTLISFITDKNHKISTKTYIIIAGVFLVITCDRIIGFSYNYCLEKKLYEVDMIGKILKDTTIENTTRQELLGMRKEILHHKYFYDYIRDEISSVFSSKTNVNTVSNINTSVKTSNTRNNFWFLMSSSGFFILVYIVVCLVYPFVADSSLFE